MNINNEEASRILRLISFADKESMADNEDLRFGLRLMDAFPDQDYPNQREDFERTLNYVPPPPRTPEMLDLSVALVIPGLWPPAAGEKELNQW